MTHMLEYFEFSLAPNLKRGKLLQDFSQFYFKFFLGDRVQRFKVKDLAQVLEVASQGDCRNHSFVSQVYIGEDLLKFSIMHGRSEGQAFIQPNVHFYPVTPGFKKAD